MLLSFSVCLLFPYDFLSDWPWIHLFRGYWQQAFHKRVLDVHVDCLSKLLHCASVRCGKAYLWLLPSQLPLRVSRLEILRQPRHSWKINAECWDLNRIFPTWTASTTCCFEVNASGSLTSEWKVWNLQLLVFYKSCVCTPDTTWHIFSSQLCKLIAVCPKIDHGLPPPKVHGVVIHGFAPIAEVISFTLPFPLSHGGLGPDADVQRMSKLHKVMRWAR